MCVNKTKDVDEVFERRFNFFFFSFSIKMVLKCFTSEYTVKTKACYNIGDIHFPFNFDLIDVSRDGNALSIVKQLKRF